MEYACGIVMFLKYDHLRVLSLKTRMICQMCIRLSHFACMDPHQHPHLCQLYHHTISLCPPFPHLSSALMFSLLFTKIFKMRIYNIGTSRLWMIYAFFLPVFCLFSPCNNCLPFGLLNESSSTSCNDSWSEPQKYS